MVDNPLGGTEYGSDPADSASSLSEHDSRPFREESNQKGAEIEAPNTGRAPVPRTLRPRKNRAVNIGRRGGCRKNHSGRGGRDHEWEGPEHVVSDLSPSHIVGGRVIVQHQEVTAIDSFLRDVEDNSNRPAHEGGMLGQTSMSGHLDATNKLNRIPNLWILWRRNLKVPVSVSESEQHVTIALDWGLSHIQISFVHASSFRAGRRALWLDLVADTPETPTPWTVIGDFNACLQSHEKRGPGNFSLGSAVEFGAMVDACLLSQDCSQQVLPWFASDHSPLLVVSSSSQRPPNCPFRFNNFWTDHEDFDRVVAESWAEWVPGSPILSLMSKLKRLKGALKGWAKLTFPHFERDLDEAKKNLTHVQEEIDSNGLSDQLFRMEADAKTALLKAQDNHEKLWAEKARLRWLTYGDTNSKFFHLSAKMRRNRNTIRSLKKQDGSIVEGKTNLGEYIVEFYEGFHKNAPTVDHLDLLDSIPRVLQQVDIFHLDSLPGNAEIMKAVWALDPESSPGPDGFSGNFFRKCWSIVEGDVCNAVKAFFRTSRMPKGVNNTFLILIPKVDGAETLDKYRPLCMSNFFCKIISKVLAMRLERFLPRLISKEQGAFQKGKLIHDNISVASELANLMYSATRGGGLGLKIDIRKAYDMISWSFLFKVMEKFGFSENWITWLHQLLASTKISVLVNGVP
ncbi:uncharacterized protein LOC122061468 [Macadamia integrifolia]|uniref:uncharacterized protein LOC122061468 n=1 Tax=Macadamia integrifolia TaxID=60698 RepID=UPI001C4FA04D|nr:uncharacterized protein LOC122061468 [Macadamia integrifolia]